jgi:hypothetical protein
MARGAACARDLPTALRVTAGRLLDFAPAQVPGRRCWAVEGAGSYGAGLASFLQGHGELEVEVGQPKRQPRRSGRHSALTHAAEDGTNLPLLLARSRHASVRSLERSARPGPEAVARHLAETDPARRRP